MTQFSTTCQILSKLYNVSDFVWWNSKRVRFWVEKFKKRSSSGKSCIQKFTWIPFFRQWSCLPPLCFFKGITLKKNSVHRESELSSENHNVLDSELKNLQRVKSWNDKLPKCEILYEKSHNVSIYELQGLQRVRFWFKSFSTGRILS